MARNIFKNNTIIHLGNKNVTSPEIFFMIIIIKIMQKMKSKQIFAKIYKKKAYTVGVSTRKVTIKNSMLVQPKVRLIKIYVMIQLLYIQLRIFNCNEVF